jgi:hypothetical protein
MQLNVCVLIQQAALTMYLSIDAWLTMRKYEGVLLSPTTTLSYGYSSRAHVYPIPELVSLSRKFLT